MERMSRFRDNTAAHQYELDHEGGPSFAAYRDRDGVRYITHVETPYEARGQGHSDRLMAAMVLAAMSTPTMATVRPAPSTMGA